MKLSKKSRYGIIALIDLSIHSKNGHVALSSIAERNGIPPQYLEQVFAGLRRYGIIKSIKGAQGGYLLNDDAKNITVASIIEALEGTYRIEEEINKGEEESSVAESVIQNTIINQVNKQLDKVFLNISLADFENDYLEYNIYAEHMYYI